jgi:hypothetical protein
MTAECSLFTPQSQAISSWWQQLAPLKPSRLWVGELLLHRLEALVLVQDPNAGATLPFFVLRALALGEMKALADLDKQLHVGAALLRQVLCRMEREELVQGSALEQWSLTARGQQALADGRYASTRAERRVFCFVANEQAGSAARYLPLQRSALATSRPTVQAHCIDVGVLQACLHRPTSWKERHGFPLDVLQVFDSATEPQPPWQQLPVWQRIIVDRPESLACVMVLTRTAAGSERLMGFSLQGEAGRLAAEPAFTLGEDWRETLLDLRADPVAEEWKDAWRSWCETHALVSAEIEACSVERQGHRLRVLAPRRLVEQLRATRSGVFRDEVWVLAGAGPLRAAAVLGVIPAT